MTKREAFIGLSVRHEQLLKEIRALQGFLSMSASHEAGVIQSIGNSVTSRLRKLSERPEMEKEVSFKEPV